MSYNYFALYGMEPKYVIDKNCVEKNYLKLQQALHPDNFTHRTNIQKLATQQSSRINSARTTLLCDVLRAQHLLALNGHPVTEDIKLNDDHFLKQQFIWHMQMDDAETINEKTYIKEELELELKTLKEKFNTAYLSASFKNAIDLLLKMRFIKKLLSKF